MNNEKWMTLADLRAAIKGMPDDMPVYIMIEPERGAYLGGHLEGTREFKEFLVNMPVIRAGEDD